MSRKFIDWTELKKVVKEFSNYTPESPTFIKGEARGKVEHEMYYTKVQLTNYVLILEFLIYISKSPQITVTLTDNGDREERYILSNPKVIEGLRRELVALARKKYSLIFREFLKDSH